MSVKKCVDDFVLVREEQEHPRSMLVVTGTLALIFAAVSFVLWIKYNELGAAYAATQEMLHKTRAQLHELEQNHSILLEKYRTLASELNALRSSYDRLNMDYLNAIKELHKLQQTIENYAEVVEQVQAWILDNAELNTQTFKMLSSSCMIGSTVNYPCVLFTQGFEYMEENQDKLSSISEFIHNKGGDCEDFALFAAAFFRTAEQLGYSIRVAAPDGGAFNIYSRWYYEGYRPLDIEVKEVNVVCGADAENNIGHCVIRVCGNPGCYWIEPQDGTVLENPFSKVDIVITKDELYWLGIPLSEIMRAMESS